MAAKAKLTLSQLLFRRTSSNNNTNSNGNNHVNNNNNNNNEPCKSDQCSNVPRNNSNSPSGHTKGNHATPRKVSLGSSTISANGGGKRQVFHEIATPPRPKSSQSHHKHGASQQPQLQGILKKPGRHVELDVGFGAGKPTRSSLHRSRSNPNPSNNPLKEVSWSCPTLEKRREVILNYFERIILENKQEQNGGCKAMRNRPNIPCENICATETVPNSEPIYEEISDCSHFSNPNSHAEKTGSLKPKLGPKKVRMNIPQDQQSLQNNKNYGESTSSPIYDKVLSRSQSMIEPLSSSCASSSASSYSGSGYYDVAPSSITASISSTSSSSQSQSLYENFRPTYTSSESDYACFTPRSKIKGEGEPVASKVVTSRVAGRSHSFHDNFRSSGSPVKSYNMADLAHQDQIYAKVCKRKKMKASNNEQPVASMPQQYHIAQPCSPHQKRQKSSSSSQSSSSSNSSTFSSEDNNTLSVQVSCGNVVTMIPVIMPCSSSFSTSCLSLSSSSDNNNDDTIIHTTSSTTTTTTAATRNNDHDNDSNGCIHYDAEKILPDKEIAYVSKSCELQDNNNNNSPSGSHYHHHHHRHLHHHQRAFITASAGNRNNLSVIHLLATYDPQKEIEEFIPTTPTFTAIIDSTECAPKSISVPVRVVDFSDSATGPGTNSNKSTVLLTEEAEQGVDDEEGVEDEEEVCYQYLPATTRSSLQRPLMVTNCSFSYDDAEEEDDYDFEDEEEDEDKEREKMYSSASSTSGSSDEDHQEMKYSFTDGRLVNRVKSISFQDESITKDLLLLTTSDSEDDEELCEHKSLLDMTSTNDMDILDDSGLDKGEKYSVLMDDEDRGFDSFLDENDGSSGDAKHDIAFSPENMKNQLTFAQTQQDVPQETLKKKAASVLDLINSEISDLHMRELELKKLHSPTPPPHTPEKSEKEMMNDGDNTGEEFEEGSSGEDDFSDSAIEYDGFTTNGSHSSGQVSPSENMNEMGTRHQGEGEGETEQEEQREIQLENELDEKNAEEKDEGNEEPLDNELQETQQQPQQRTPGLVRPLAEEEDKTIKFDATDETPIEREIRLTREREEEFRRLNNLSCNKSTSPTSADRISPSSQVPKVKLGSLPVKPTSVSSRPEKDTPSLPASGVSKDLQYEMATARFKREIEESMKREKELVLEGLLKKGANESVEETNFSESPPQEESETKHTEEQEKPTQNPVSPPPLPPKEEPQQQQQQQQPTQKVAPPESVLRKPTIAKLSIAKLPAARFFSPPGYNGNKPNRITPVVSPIIAKNSLAFPSPTSSSTSPTVGGSLPIGISRPSFTSLEKYILQSSMNFKTIAASPSASIDEEPAKPIPEPVPAVKPQSQLLEDPLRIVKAVSVDEETVNEEKEEEDEKPKRRYIPAQDKIQKEIEELVMREKELNRTRAKWKSTLDLPESMEEPKEHSQITQSTLSLHASSSISNENEVTVVPLVNGEGDEPTVKVNNDDGNTNIEELDAKKAAEDARQVTRVKAPARRRNSWLINQWEERIRQQQQTNNKK